MTETFGDALRLSDGRRRGAAGTPRPCLFLALELDRPTQPPARWSLADVDEVVIGRGESGTGKELVARAMGKARTQIQRWIKRYGIEPAHYRRG